MKLWFFISFLFVILISLQFYDYLGIELPNTGEKLAVTIDILSNFILAFGLPFILSLILSFLPFKKRKYLTKVKSIFPVITIIFLLSIIINFSYIVYLKEVKGYAIYESVRTCTNCKSILTGDYESKGRYISRSKIRQTQINKTTNEARVFDVIWVSECEYHLYSVEDRSDILKVKITSVNDDSYECYVQHKRAFSKYHSIKIIKK